MPRIALKQRMLILAFALIGWALCGAIIGIGRSVMSMATTLVIHAIGAPLIFGVLALVYFRRFNYTTPLQTAVIFVASVIIMDGLVVASVIERSFAMFASALGTWIPFALIFLSTYLVGWYLQAQVMHQRIAESGRASTR